MSNTLKIYPSGFLGSSTVEQTKPMDVITTARQLFNKGVAPKVSQYEASQEVCDIWSDVISGTPEYKTFEFKERILRCALQAFGTTKLVDWIGNQVDGPFFSDNHFRWIDETILYIFGGKNREMSSNNWRVLLTAGGSDSTKERFSKVVKHYLLGEKMPGQRYEEPYRGDITISDFIAMWCTADGGLDDLTTSLDTLFGKR